MSVELIRMTGAELKRIKERAGLKEDALKTRLGLSPSAYYALTNDENKDKEIPDKVEARVTADKELSKWANLEIVGVRGDKYESLEKAISTYGETVLFIRDMMGFMKDLMASNEKKYDTLEKDCNVFRTIVESAHKEGRLQLKEGKH